jgi:hypothetical protein
MGMNTNHCTVKVKSTNFKDFDSLISGDVFSWGACEYWYQKLDLCVSGSVSWYYLSIGSNCRYTPGEIISEDVMKEMCCPFSTFVIAREIKFEITV